MKVAIGHNFHLSCEGVYRSCQCHSGGRAAHWPCLPQSPVQRSVAARPPRLRAAVLSMPAPETPASAGTRSLDDTNNIVALNPPADNAHLVTTVHSPEELDALLSEDAGRLTVLCCKARSCRPCKMFSRKYLRLAASFQDVSFCEMYGDENSATRKLMIEQQVKVTPTFLLYRGREIVHQLSGINEENLRTAIEEH